MEERTEVVEPQKTTPEAATEPADKVTISQAELEDLRHKAEVSSQNYERTKKLEARLKELETLQTEPSDDIYSDEGKLLRKEIQTLNEEIATIKATSSKRELQDSNPIFREKWQDFEEFRNNPENKGMNLKTAAKAYLVENGLLESPRKGLEKPTGGERKPSSAGMTSEDKLNLMKTNFKEWQRLTIEGKI